ncbi:MAG: S8 family serine peptidase, partial [Candidatus Kapaibacterium sp.]
EDINHNGLFDPWPSTEQRKDAYGNLVFGDLDGIDEDGNGYVDDVIGYDFIDQSSANFGDTKDRDPIPQDEESHTHGTAVAGVIAAKANNKIGVAGIAPKCKLVALRAFDATGNAEDDDIASAIVYAADNNVRILNLSFGDIIPSLLQRDAIRYANSKGVLIFASSGNDGSTSPHYPSDFDECVSVGGTVLATDNVSESQWSQSTHGSGMDLIAPAVQIYTLFGANSYQSISGTSFSSPEAAAVAGLIWSNNPKLSNMEVRSILESTCKDFNPSGFGPFDGNGRIDAFAAVNYPGSAAIKITSPHTNDGFHVGDKIAIIGSVVSTLFQDYSLSAVKATDKPTIAPVNPIALGHSQIINDTLGIWDTRGLDTGSYVLHLSVSSSDGRKTIENITVHFLSNKPSISSLSSIPIFINEKRGLLIQARTDTLTTTTLYYRQQGSHRWLTKKDDRYTKGHNILLSTSDAPALIPLEIKLVAMNGAGDSVSQTIAGTISSDEITQRGFSQKNYSLPLGYALDTVLSTPNGDQVVMNTFPDGTDFGPLKIFSFDPKTKHFKISDSLNYPWIPRSIGNTTGDDKPELLLQAGHSYELYKQNANHSLLGNIINADTNSLSKLAIGLVDVDGDGRQELLVEDTERLVDHFRNILKVFRVAGSTTSLLGKLIDTTAPGLFEADNNYNSPDARFAAISNTGKTDILAVDDDADIVAYEYDDTVKNHFSSIYQDTNDGAAEGRLLTTGDFNGDGKQDIALAFHTPYDPNIDNEYDASYWTVKVMLGNGDATFKTIYTDYFYLARSLSPYRASTGSIRNVTGNAGDDLVLSLFPNLYLLEYDAASQTMKPIWHYPVSNSPRGALTFDFDKNGKREFGFNAGDSLHFFEREDNFADQTKAPGGLETIPRDTNRVDLSWGSVSGAGSYFILRVNANTGTFYDSIGTTTNLFYSDTTVKNDSDYFYSVEAFDATKKISISEPSFGVFAHVHPKPRIINVTSHDKQIFIKTTLPLSTTAIDGGVFILDDSVVCSTAIIESDSEVIITSPQNIQGAITHKIQVNSFTLRDKWNSPFDTSIAVQWTPPISVTPKDFYIVRWRFEGSSRIYVEFNIRPENNALDISHYTLSPFGTFIRIERDPSNVNSLYLYLAPGTIISALGTPFILCIKNITGEFNIPLEETEGNCAGETFTEPNLDNVMVYPNPAKATDEELTFAGLTAEAEISIYSLDLRFLKRLKTSEKNGGVKWDMHDDAGRIVPSGVYWYHITGKDDNGNDVKPNEAKFVIIRNK